MVSDVAPHKFVTRIIGKVGRVARVAEFVEVDDVPVGVMPQHEFDKVRADETGAASDKDARAHGE